MQINIKGKSDYDLEASTLQWLEHSLHSSEPFCFKITSSFGKLTKEPLSNNAPHIQILVSGTIRIISRLSPDQMNYSGFLKACFSNPLMQFNKEKYKCVEKLFIFEVDDLTELLTKLCDWFEESVGSTYFHSQETTKKVFSKLAEMTIEKKNLLSAERLEDCEISQTLVDIGLIIYPDIERLFFELSRLKIFAFFKESADNENKLTYGLKLEYESSNFDPNISVIEGMKSDIKHKAIAEFEHHFKDLEIISIPPAKSSSE
jgi:hypothetical protein